MDAVVGRCCRIFKKENKAMKVLLKTSEGDVVILLSELTPGHRDNFVKM